MDYLRRGEGGPPTSSLPKASWGLSLIGSFPSRGTLCFLYKNTPVPMPCYNPWMIQSRSPTSDSHEKEPSSKWNRTIHMPALMHQTLGVSCLHRLHPRHRPHHHEIMDLWHPVPWLVHHPSHVTFGSL